MLNNLINKNKEPKVNMDYIYLFHMTWREGSLDSIPIKYGTIVNNVKKLYNDSFTFNIKGETDVLRCNYGWAFAENTPKNIKKIKLFTESNLKLELIKKETLKFRNDIQDLNGPPKL